MLEYAGSQRAGLRAERDAPRLLSVVRSLDWVLLLGVAALVVVGLWGVAGVTKFASRTIPSYYLNRQILYAASAASCSWLRRSSIRISTAATGARSSSARSVVIAFVLLAGHAAHGSTRWISLGFFTFQPSEFGKLLFVLAIAGMLADRQRIVGTWETTLKVVGIGLIPAVLVFIQPDLGTALVYMAALAAMLFIAGIPVAPPGRARRRRRAHRGRSPLGRAGGRRQRSSRATSNSGSRASRTRPPARSTRGTTSSSRMTAIGSGQIRGLGPNGATQVDLGFLPESQTDFVFAGFAEQRGFVGAAILLALYLLVLWSGLRVVTVARDLFSAIVAGGIVVALLFQIFVNVGMTMGIAPITGIPLPFVSVGGSSLIANLAAMGVLLAIYARGRVSRYSRRR